VEKYENVLDDAGYPQHTLFHVVLKAGNGAQDNIWRVAKRFLDFDQLHADLSRLFSTLPAFPPKTWVKSYIPAFLSERMLLLSRYVTELAENVMYQRSQPFADFFHLQEQIGHLGWRPLQVSILNNESFHAFCLSTLSIFCSLSDSLHLNLR
jgi:hypothetical protein